MTDETLIQTPVGLTKAQRKHCMRFGNQSAYIRSLIERDIIEADMLEKRNK